MFKLNKDNAFFPKLFQRTVFFLAAAISVLNAGATTRLQVIDSVSKKSIPYVAVFIEGTGRGLLTDENGRANLHIAAPPDSATIRLSVMGYRTKTFSFPLSAEKIVVPLYPQNIALDEVTVSSKRKKYSKKDNPALQFAKQIRNCGPLTDPREQHENYSYSRFERISLGLNNFNPESMQKGLFKNKFDFLEQHTDTSEISGNRVLIVSVKEKASDVKFRREPRAEKEIVTAIRRNGLDDITDEESMQTFLEDIFREIDLYENDINILQNRFVSPLSRIAPDFYKFFLTDTVEIEGEQCIELSFTPFNTAVFGFSGQIYVPVNDTTMFVRRVDMHLPPGINLNFVDRLFIRQDFERAPDGTRLKTNDDFTAEISILPAMQGLYARRSTRYSNHSFNADSNDDTVFQQLAHTIVADSAYNRSDRFWHETAKSFQPATMNENRISALVSKMRSVPLYYWSERVLKILVSGYVSTAPKGKTSKFDIGPMNTTFSGNELEGMRLRFGGMTTAALSPHWFARGYVAYGTRDHKLKYSAELEYSFIEKKNHSREFPIHSVRILQLFDVDQLGQHYLFTNMDNVFLALKRMKNNLMTYHRVSEFLYTLELPNNFSVQASLRSERQQATRFIEFTDGFGKSFSHYTESTLSLTLRFAPGEKFYQTKSYRFPVNLDAPVFQLTHTFGPANFAGNAFAINKTELSMQKRFWFSAFGFTDIILKTGHVWQQAPFPNLLIPNANLSYTIQPESFALMNPMEFINDSYFSWDVTYWANGAILNYIPLVKKLKLREAFACRGISGRLSDRNNPDLHPNLFRFPSLGHTVDMNWKPYIEVSAGIDNLFKCLRLDYVWRLTYRSATGIDKSGLRVAFHMTF